MPNNRRGVLKADDSTVLYGIYRQLRTGSWAFILDRDGPPTTCYNRFVRWRNIGIWDRIFEAVSKAYGGDIQISMLPPSASTSTVRREKSRHFLPLAAAWNSPDPRCLGRSRGGLATKIDADGLPIAIQLSPGLAHHGSIARHLLSTVAASETLLADADRKRRPAFWPSSIASVASSRAPSTSLITSGKSHALEKNPENYLVKLAAARSWMRFINR